MGIILGKLRYWNLEVIIIIKILFWILLFKMLKFVSIIIVFNI